MLDISLDRDILAGTKKQWNVASHVPDAPKPRKPSPVSSVLSSGSVEGVGVQASNHKIWELLVDFWQKVQNFWNG